MSYKIDLEDSVLLIIGKFFLILPISFFCTLMLVVLQKSLKPFAVMKEQMEMVYKLLCMKLR